MMKSRYTYLYTEFPQHYHFYFLFFWFALSVFQCLVALRKLELKTDYTEGPRTDDILNTAYMLRSSKSKLLTVFIW